MTRAGKVVCSLVLVGLALGLATVGLASFGPAQGGTTGGALPDDTVDSLTLDVANADVVLSRSAAETLNVNADSLELERSTGEQVILGHNGTHVRAGATAGDQWEFEDSIRVFHPALNPTHFIQIRHDSAGGVIGTATGYMNFQAVAGSEFRISDTNQDRMLLVFIDTPGVSVELEAGLSSADDAVIDFHGLNPVLGTVNGFTRMAGIQVGATTAVIDSMVPGQILFEDGQGLDGPDSAGATIVGPTDQDVHLQTTSFRVWDDAGGAGDNVELSHDGTNGALRSAGGQLAIQTDDSSLMQFRVGNSGSSEFVIADGAIQPQARIEWAAGLALNIHHYGPNDDELHVSAFNQNNDTATNDLRLSGGDAFGTATGANRNGGAIKLVPGDNETAEGGTEGRVQVWDPDEGGSDYVEIYHATNGFVTAATGELVVGATDAGIATVSSQVVTITDGTATGQGALRHLVVYEAHTADDFLVQAESGSVHSNAGATAIITLTLADDMPDGATFTFVRVAAQNVRIDPAGANNIEYSGGSMSDGEYLSLDSAVAKLTLVYDGTNTAWIALEEFGTLTEETP